MESLEGFGSDKHFGPKKGGDEIAICSLIEKQGSKEKTRR